MVRRPVALRVAVLPATAAAVLPAAAATAAAAELMLVTGLGVALAWLASAADIGAGRRKYV